MTEYDLTLKLRDGVYAIETSSLRLVWMKHESYILHTSAAMYTFQNLNTCINDKLNKTPRQDRGKLGALLLTN